MQAIIRKVKEVQFSEKLYQLRQKLGITQEEMSMYFDLKLRMYANYERGDMIPTGIKLVKFDKIIKDLESGILPPTKSKENVQKGNIIHVPLYAYGGFLQGYRNRVYVDSLERFSLPGVTGEHYAFEVDGMSMHDLASPGDTAIARPEEKLEWMIKGKAYVLQTIDGILIKLFEKIKDERAYFKSVNPEYQEISIPMKSIKRVYFVTRILKKL